MATIEFNYETTFTLDNEQDYSNWITRIIVGEKSTVGDLAFVFCDDEYLSKMNKEYLSHDTLTDIITFDYVEGDTISGDVLISEERVRENAEIYEVDFWEEMKRVMAHGVLHLLGYKDKTKEDTALMRAKEDEKMKLFHVEQ